MTRFLLVTAVVALFAVHCHADVIAVAPAGFEVSETVAIQATAKQVYAGLGKIGRWWSPNHTISDNAANLHIDLRVGGCFCERADTGQERLHLTVVDIAPNQSVRLRGALGPLQGEGVDGALTWSIKPTAAGVSFTQDYIVGGYLREGSDKWAPLVDIVLHEQLTRFKSFIESGAPVSAAKP